MSVTRASRTSVSSADLTQVGCATAVVAKKSVTDASPRIHFVMRVLLCGLSAAPRQSGSASLMRQQACQGLRSSIFARVWLPDSIACVTLTRTVVVLTLCAQSSRACGKVVRAAGPRGAGMEGTTNGEADQRRRLEKGRGAQELGQMGSGRRAWRPQLRHARGHRERRQAGEEGQGVPARPQPRRERTATRYLRRAREPRAPD